MSGISFIVGNAHRYGLSAEELQKLQSDYEENQYLKELIDRNADTNIERWKKSQPKDINDSKIVRTGIGRRANNYSKAGTTVYPHPAFNPTIYDGLERGNGIYSIGDDSYVVDNEALAKAKGLERWQYKTCDELIAQYPDGVSFDESGMPDFTPYAQRLNGRVIVEQIEGGFTGDSNRDRNIATRQLEAKGVDWDHGQYTWHHLPDGHSLISVDWWIHRLTPHAGGHAIGA